MTLTQRQRESTSGYSAEIPSILVVEMDRWKCPYSSSSIAKGCHWLVSADKAGSTVCLVCTSRMFVWFAFLDCCLLDFPPATTITTTTETLRWLHRLHAASYRDIPAR